MLEGYSIFHIPFSSRDWLRVKSYGGGRRLNLTHSPPPPPPPPPPRSRMRSPPPDDDKELYCED